ncbi:MAG: phosphatase domain-containing protein [Bdellovibrionota bacterium]
MVRLLSGLRGQNLDDYNVWKLVDSRIIDSTCFKGHKLHIVCDIDKTYLETEFESLVKIAKIAFEDAKDKVTVKGASDILLATRWGNTAYNEEDEANFPIPLHFVSSSPPQLRNVLGEKLAIDGVDWSSDTFKNQAYNLKKGRFSQLRQQVAYKTAAIFRLIEQIEGSAQLVLIGDNVESDAMIYLGIKMFIEKRLSPMGYQKYLQLLGITEKVSEKIIERLTIRDNKEVLDIYIRDLPNAAFTLLAPLTTPIYRFSDYYQLALMMIRSKLIDVKLLKSLTRSFHNKYNMPLYSIYQSLENITKQDGVDPKFDEEISSVRRYIKPFLEDSIIEETGSVPSTTDTNPNNRNELADFECLDEGKILDLADKWVSAIEKKRQALKADT